LHNTHLVHQQQLASTTDSCKDLSIRAPLKSNYAPLNAANLFKLASLCIEEQQLACAEAYAEPFKLK
jgi:hypothetical protein